MCHILYAQPCLFDITYRYIKAHPNVQMYTLCTHVLRFTFQCSMYNQLVPHWHHFGQPITEEHRVFCFALIVPIDADDGGGKLLCVDHVLSFGQGPW